MVRFRRVTDAGALDCVLGSGEKDVLPIVFSDNERSWIASAIDSNVASLDDGAELFTPFLAVSDSSSDDLVVAPESGQVTLLAERYAAVTGRVIVRGDSASIESRLPRSVPKSVTWFCELNEIDIAESLRLLRESFSRRYGMPPRVGILTAEDIVSLTWVLAKQLLPPAKPADSSTTILLNIETNLLPLPSAKYLTFEETAVEALGTLQEARGTLILLGHSRPHCGRLMFHDGDLGVCGLPSGGADGRCVDGVVCHFRDRPRFVAQQSRAQRIYYDGCSTAVLGGQRVGLFGLPRAAMLSHAVFRSATREYIGNVHSGSYDATDLYWLIGLSALNYTPAECVEVINCSRLRAGREGIGSGAYFGDATNSAWPSCDAWIGNVIVEGEKLRVAWASCKGVLIAKLPGRLWAEFIDKDLLHVYTEHPSKPLISILPDPWSDASLVLAVPRVDVEGGGPVDLELRRLQSPVLRDIGGTLLDGWLARLPSFTEKLTGAADFLEDQLVQIRRTVGEREDHALLVDLVRFAQRAEAATAYKFDELLIETALERSRTRWELLEEYESRCRPEQLLDPCTCTNCGASVHVTRLSDYARPNLKRLVSTCSSCGVVADLPVWPLEIQLEPASLFWNRRTLQGRARVFNRGDDTRRIVLGATLVGGGQIELGSSDRFRGLVSRQSVTEFDFAITHERFTGTMRFRVFIASRSGFGFVGGILLVHPSADNLTFQFQQDTPLRGEEQC
jgi:hypothetical protein